MNNFCVLPFNSISVTALGDLRPCCSVYDKNFGINIKEISTDEIINHKEIIKLRKEFLSDNRASICQRCWKIEEIGNESFRQVHNNDPIYGLNAVSINRQETINFLDINFLDITLGNKCNLACRMCNPESSSLVSAQWAHLHSIPILKDRIRGLVDFDRPTKDKLLDVITRAENLKAIYMLGGEPLVSEFHDEIIDLLISKDRAKNIKLKYSTNLQIDVERKLDQWIKFRKIDLSLSIDGRGDTYEYIRWPGKWSKIEKNLSHLIDYKKEHKNIDTGVATTVQNLNADNLSLLIENIADIGKGSINFYFIPVAGFNNLEFLPTDILIKSKNTLDKFDNANLFMHDDLKRMFIQAIEKSKDLNRKNVSEFFVMQKTFDGLREQNLFNFRSHFADLADTFNIEKW